MPTPNNTVIDGDFATATVQGTGRYIAPFEGTASTYVYEEDYTQSLASFTPLALNTTHPTLTSYYLVRETPLQPVGVYDIVKWTRVYAQVPATRYEYTTLAYQFIGYLGFIVINVLGATISGTAGRKRFTQSVTAQIAYDYFIVDGVAHGGHTYTAPEDITKNLATKYYLRMGSISGTTFTGLYTAGSAEDIAQGIPTDYIDGGSYTPSGGGTVTFTPVSLVPSVPTRGAYQALVSTDAGTANSYSVIAEDSTLTRWMGNIYVRQTKRVKAL